MDTPPLTLSQAKDLALENLEAIRMSLIRCVDEGMMDLEDTLHNEVLGLMDELDVLESWPEMEELIIRSKTIEHDIEAWLAMHGRTSISLVWPQIPST